MSILRHQNNRLIIISKQNCQCWWIQFSIIIIIIIIIKVMSHWITIEWRLQSLIWWCCIIFFFVLFYSFTIILNLDESRSEFRFFSFIHPYCSVPTKMKSILLNLNISLNITIINGSLLKSIQPKWFLCFMIRWSTHYIHEI